MALTKISRSLLDTGVSDSSDATAITITSDEEVGIGTTTPNSYAFNDPAKLVVANTSGHSTISLVSGTSSKGYFAFADGTSGAARYPGSVQYDHSSNYLSFHTNDGSERMRLTSAGKLGFNFTAPAALIDIKSGGSTSTPLRVLASSTTTSDYNDLWSVAEISGNGQMSIFDASQNQDILLSTHGTSTFAGALSKGSGSFKIDHPLESKKDTHHLYHSFVEGPSVDNLYRGTVTLNNGIATINLDAVSNMTDGTFVALNREVQCYTTNETDWDAVKGNVEGNVLTISCQNTSSSATVSWLVIGQRQDENIYSSTITDENGKLIVEKLKSEEG